MKSIYEFLLKSKTAVSTQDTDYVDLGLPSGLLWATCNIGADKPYEYGDYFMWGSTTPTTNKRCDWQYAPFNDGHLVFNEKYFKSIQDNICTNDVLAPKYDAATQIWGDEWRMPKAKECRELINNTTYEWATKYKGIDVNGLLFKSKTNDAELFIPAGGYRNGSIFNFQGSYVYLWSSSLYTSIPEYAICMLSTASHGNINDIDIVFIQRMTATNIRAVRDR